MTSALRLFFFFQAEDGIRDGHVTGVQTCALPIWTERRALGLHLLGDQMLPQPSRDGAAGSEERRVGKECRSRWSPYPEKKKKVVGLVAGSWTSLNYTSADARVCDLG